MRSQAMEAVIAYGSIQAVSACLGTWRAKGPRASESAQAHTPRAPALVLAPRLLGHASQKAPPIIDGGGTLSLNAATLGCRVS